MNILFDFHCISIILLVYIAFNLLAIFLNERINGTRKILIKKLFQEVVLLLFLNICLILAKSFSFILLENKEKINTIKEIVSYIYLFEVSGLIGIQILFILGNRNPILKNIIKFIGTIFEKIDIFKIIKKE